MLHAECAKGALEDAADQERMSTAISAPPATRRGSGGLSMVDYLGLKLRHLDSTDTGGSSYLLQVGHVAEAIAAGKCSVALITLARRAARRGDGDRHRRRARRRCRLPESGFEFPYAPATANMYAMCAMRHMYQYGTTSEQMAWSRWPLRITRSKPARDAARRRDRRGRRLNSPMIADPLHRLDCCVISDGGGAMIMTTPEIAKSLKRPLVKVIGAGEAPKHQMGGKVDLTYSGAVWSGRRPGRKLGSSRPTSNTPRSTTASRSRDHAARRSRLLRKGQGGRFVADGNLIAAPASCRSTPTAAASATTTRLTAAA